MTQFTSFVAVEEMTVTTGGEPRRIEVPVEMPEGVSYEGVFGKDKAEVRMMPAMSQARTMAVNMAMERSDALPASKPASKLDPSLIGKTGKLEVRVWLVDISAQTIEQLKKLGLEIILQPKSAKMVVGRIAAEKLAALAELKAVKYVAPM